ncbi:MAG: MCE family protein [Deltaproteobacteria bacterium]|nr:MCE family protein [Deltaproteobacteria bacterium]
MSTEFKVGVFFIVGLLILLAVFEFIGGIPFLGREYTLKTYFQSVDELREDNPVKLNGVDIGTVSKIKIADSRIEVIMKIKKGVFIREDSVASIKLTGLLGTSYINISFGSSESPVAAPGSVIASQEPVDINEILGKVESAVGSLDKAFAAFDVLGENKEQITKIINNVNSVLGDLSEGKGTLGKLLKDDSLYEEAKGALANINDISSSVKEGKGTLGKLVTDPSLFDETKAAMSNLAKLSDSLSTSKGTLGKLLNDDSLYNQANEAATNLNSVLKKINSGQGTLGRLVNDDSLYFDAQNTLKKVDKGVDTAVDLAPLGIIGTSIGVITLF